MSDIKKAELVSVDLTESDSKLNAEEKIIIGRWIGEKILESQKKIEESLEELCKICKKEK